MIGKRSRLHFLKRSVLLTASAMLMAAPIVAGVGKISVVQTSQPLTRPPDTPKWDNVSVKPCGEYALGQNSTETPGKLELYCQTVRTLVQLAYLTYAGPLSVSSSVTPAGPVQILIGSNQILTLNGAPIGPLAGGYHGVPIEGPTWIQFAEYDIHAQTAAAATPAMMLGPMMQEILEDKFKLKVHHEVRPGEGPSDYIVIDHIEKPASN